jgi:hypothetical protein
VTGRGQASRERQNLFMQRSIERFGAGSQYPRCITNFHVFSVHIGWDETAKASCGCFAISTVGRVRLVWGPPGSSDNWRCIALQNLSEVKPLDGSWQTAPNHSHPASCIVDPDIDAEDYPEGSPQ